MLHAVCCCQGGFGPCREIPSCALLFLLYPRLPTQDHTLNHTHIHTLGRPWQNYSTSYKQRETVKERLISAVIHSLHCGQTENELAGAKEQLERDSGGEKRKSQKRCVYEEKGNILVWETSWSPPERDPSWRTPRLVGRRSQWGRAGLRSGGDIWPRRSAVALLPDVTTRKNNSLLSCIVSLNNKTGLAPTARNIHLPVTISITVNIMRFDALLLKSLKTLANGHSLQSPQLSHLADCFCPVLITNGRNWCAVHSYADISACCISAHLCDRCHFIKIN